MALVRLGLGSNLGDREANLERAMSALGGLGDVVARSSLYESAAWGVSDQPAFINAAALLETSLAPRALLAELEGLEVELGRTETFRWGPRLIDLDILAYADLTVAEPDLTIPHARLYERAFALVPLAEIDPAYRAALAALPEAARAGVSRLPGRIAFVPARTAPAVDWDQTVARVRRAATFCVEAGLERFRIDEADLTIEVSRHASTALPAPAESVSDATAPGVPAVNGAAVAESAPGYVLKAEFVGIVRFSRPPVGEGAMLEAGRELAYVEALGIRNPIRTPTPGKLATVFVGDGDAVEYGQPLFALEDAR